MYPADMVPIFIELESFEVVLKMCPILSVPKIF